MPDSDFSLAEIRVLYEIGTTASCVSKKLVRELRIDSGYLSRILKRLEKQGIVSRKQSAGDLRVYELHLTQAGREILKKLNELSDRQIGLLLEKLTERGRRQLAECMETIRALLTEQAEDRVAIRCDLRPGDVGYLIYLHGRLYAKECGYNHLFEGYVCKTFYELYQSYDPQKDRFWLAEAGGNIIGSIAVVGHSGTRAQLRYFLVSPEYRGTGLGTKLFSEALDYAKRQGYQSLFLETTDDQKTAIRMYKKAGFRLTQETGNHAWGVSHTGQVYELSLELSD
jgi:DNA-binding MarR family transcriptional regulator/predicted GNAT family N-acyltransferase